MGEVLLQYMIKGSSPEVDLEAVAKEVREKLATVDKRIKMQDGVEIKPLYFGIKGATVQFIIPEEDGMQDKLEEFIRGIDGVEDAELTFVSRL
ncbi:MAG: elongation factor 1-beta [Methanobacteriota archaeon]|nr:MAG: elongation factor 1-beta [Euryarchaeota archaeon]